MVKARTWFTLLFVSLGTVAATASCGSSDEGTGGPSAGASGGGIIAGAGRTGGSTGRAGSAGSTSNGGGANVSGTFGIACTADAQCGDGVVCAKANGSAFVGGGPSHGMCTKACDTTDLNNVECDTLKAGAQCFDFGTEAAPQGYCLDACELDDPLDLSTKCAGRSDFVCVDLGESTVLPFCVPHCRSDAECGTGLFCDKSSLLGLCSKTKPTGDPVGTDCDPQAQTSTCAGYCIRTSEQDVTPVTGECVELCAGGFECMYGSGANPSPGGFCAGQLSDPFGALDLGYCLPNCACSGDCQLEGDLCRKWTADEADLATALGAPGVCYPVVAGSVELSCGEGGAGGDGAGGASGAEGGASGSN